MQQQGEQVRVTVDAIADDGSYLNDLTLEASVVAPDLTAQALALQQVAPGRYEAVFTPRTEGAYFVRVAGAGPQGQAAVAQTAGWVLAYSPEYRSLEGDPDYLAYIARLGGGSIVSDAQTVFAHNLDAERASRPVWPWLLLLATVLLPVDIAVRRLVITRADLAKLAALLPTARRRVEAAAPRTSRVGALIGVKERARRAAIPGRGGSETRPPVPPPAEPDAAAPPPDEPVAGGGGPETRPAAPPAPGSTASSLLRSKRARRDGEGP
jgi:hypothetical protein